MSTTVTGEFQVLMEAEAQLLREYAGLEERLPLAAARGDWPELEGLLGRMEGLARRIEEADGRRDACYRRLKAALCLREEDDFHRLARSLPEDDRETLTGAYRRLRVEVVRVRSASALAGHYLRAVSGAVNEALGELIPHRRGRLYSRGGRARQALEDALLINRQL